MSKKNHNWGKDFRLGMERELDARERKCYEQYCEYCRKIGSEPGSEKTWWLETQGLPTV